MDVTRVGHQVAAEGRRDAVDLGRERHRALGVARRRENPDVVAAPRERLVVPERARHRHRPRQREPDAGDVVVVVDPLHPPEGVGLTEQRRFPLRDRDRGAVLHQARVALALVAVVMRVEDPLDLADPCLVEMLEDSSGPEIDQEAAVAPHEEIDVARVAVPEQARREPDEPAARRRGVGMTVTRRVAGVMLGAHRRPPSRERREAGASHDRHGSKLAA